MRALKVAAIVGVGMTIAGVAFAVGALWKLGQARQQTRTESLLARLSERGHAERRLAVRLVADVLDFADRRPAQ